MIERFVEHAMRRAHCAFHFVKHHTFIDQWRISGVASKFAAYTLLSEI